MTESSRLDLAVAVIGTAFALPGARTLDEFERMVFAGDDAFLSRNGSTSPPENWVDRAGYLEDWCGFDHRLFGLSLRDSVIIDPQHRLFLQHSWKAAECAGYNPRALPRRTAVISTASDTDYAHVVSQYQELSDKYHPFEIEIGSNKEQQSLRVSHVLNLCGPSYGIQSACSSGLLVVHAGMQALQLGDADLVLAGGSCLPFPLHEGYEYRSGMNLSKTGVLRSFDRAADGMVPGFGCVAFVLKRLADATRDGDRILAVLRGSAVNNDGSNKATYVSPSSASVAENIQTLLNKSGLQSSDIDFVEAHGSGTYIGDVIEAAALRQVFAASAREAETVAVASAKASIGHLDTVAGLAGLLRAIVQLRRGGIAPAANHTELNPRISFDGGPLYVPTRPSFYSGTLSGIVNALGIGGTNCALAIQSAPHSAPRDEKVRPTLLEVTVGADTNDRLSVLMGQFARVLKDGEFDLHDVAFSLNRRAEGKRFTARFLVEDMATLIEHLMRATVTPGSPGVTDLPRQNAGPARARIIDLGVSEIDPASRVNLPNAAPGQGKVKSTAGMEDSLRRIWQSALLLKQVEASASFRGEGGHSMLALTVVDEINQTFGVRTDLDWFDRHDRFEEQVRALAALTEAPRQHDRQLVKLMRAANCRRPRVRLVLVHASLSGSETYKPLLAHLDPDIEVLAIDSHNLYADEADIIRTHEALAALYVNQLTKMTPDTNVPLCLGGWSLGGMLASAMATKLAGRYRVKSLIAVDSVVFRESYAPLFDDTALSYFIDEVGLLGRQLGEARYRNHTHRLNEVFRAEREMARNFVPSPQTFPFLNIVAERTRLRMTDELLLRAFGIAKRDNGWRESPGQEIVRIDAHHMEIVSESRLAEIATHFNRFMRETCTST